MPSPDYSSYDAGQLIQARQAIDAARFPERAHELDRRLADLKQADALRQAEAVRQSLLEQAGKPRSAGRVLALFGIRK